jgi:hypothetical protein
VRVECGRRIYIYIYTLWGDEPVEGKVEVVRDGWMWEVLMDRYVPEKKMDLP